MDHDLAVRRALGYKLDAIGRHLRSFAQFASAQGDAYIKTPTAIAWAGQARSENQRFNRLQAVIKFAQFCHAEDDRHEILPDQVFCSQRQRPTPYIFTDHELKSLIVQAAQLGPPGSLRPQTYSTLFGLLAATGLRISAALALRFQDVTDDGLVIRESKFHKSRLVPLHKTTTWYLESTPQLLPDIAQTCEQFIDGGTS